MASNHSGSLLDRLVGVCLAVLIGAAAVYVAVRLIEAVAMALLVILAVAGFVAGAVLILRSRGREW